MTNDELQIRSLVAAWAERTRAGDLDAVLDMMTDDVVFLRPGHPPMIGRRAFEEASRARTPVTSRAPQIDAEQEIEEVAVVGDAAWMRTRLRVVITPVDGSPPSTRSGYTLSVLRREDGRWRIARDANMLA